MAKIEIDYFESTKLLEAALYSHTVICECEPSTIIKIIKIENYGEKLSN